MFNSKPEDYMNQFNENTQKMFEPWAKLNKTFLKNAEMMTEFSLNTIKSYSEMGLENMRQLAEMDSPEAAKDFGSKQAEMLNTVSQQILSDAQRLTELGNSMQDEVMQLMSEAYGQTNEQMQENMQKTADQATKTAQEFAQNMNKMAEQVTEQATSAVKTATKAASDTAKKATTAATSSTANKSTPTSASTNATDKATTTGTTASTTAKKA